MITQTHRQTNAEDSTLVGLLEQLLHLQRLFGKVEGSGSCLRKTNTVGGLKEKGDRTREGAVLSVRLSAVEEEDGGGRDPPELLLEDTVPLPGGAGRPGGAGGAGGAVSARPALAVLLLEGPLEGRAGAPEAPLSAVEVLATEVGSGRGGEGGLGALGGVSAPLRDESVYECVYGSHRGEVRAADFSEHVDGRVLKTRKQRMRKQRMKKPPAGTAGTPE